MLPTEEIKKLMAEWERQVLNQILILLLDHDRRLLRLETTRWPAPRKRTPTGRSSPQRRYTIN